MNVPCPSSGNSPDATASAAAARNVRDGPRVLAAGSFIWRVLGCLIAGINVAVRRLFTGVVAHLGVNVSLAEPPRFAAFLIATSLLLAPLVGATVGARVMSLAFKARPRRKQAGLIQACAVPENILFRNLPQVVNGKFRDTFGRHGHQAYVVINGICGAVRGFVGHAVFFSRAVGQFASWRIRRFVVQCSPPPFAALRSLRVSDAGALVIAEPWWQPGVLTAADIVQRLLSRGRGVSSAAPGRAPLASG